MDLRKAAPDFIAAYLSFLFRFSQSPAEALKPYTDAEPAPESEQAVSGKLIGFCLLGVAVATLVARIGDAIGMAKDSSEWLAIFGRIGEMYLPLAVLLGIVVVTIGLHIIARLTAALLRKTYGGESLGTVASSVNASAAFACWYIPIATMLLVGMRVIISHATVQPFVFLIVLVPPLTLGFLIYFTAAFSAAHRISLYRAGLILAATVVLVSLAVDQVS